MTRPSVPLLTALIYGASVLLGLVYQYYFEPKVFDGSGRLPGEYLLSVIGNVLVIGPIIALPVTLSVAYLIDREA